MEALQVKRIHQTAVYTKHGWCDKQFSNGESAPLVAVTPSKSRKHQLSILHSDCLDCPSDLEGVECEHCLAEQFAWTDREYPRHFTSLSQHKELGKAPTLLPNIFVRYAAASLPVAFSLLNVLTLNMAVYLTDVNTPYLDSQGPACDHPVCPTLTAGEASTRDKYLKECSVNARIHMAATPLEPTWV